MEGLETVGDYEYKASDHIGHGAFAIVYRGRNKKDHSQIVAIKNITKKNLMKNNSVSGKEVKILKELSKMKHENVVGLLDFKDTPTNVFLVMEYCNGGDLADYLAAKKTLSEDTIRLFLRQIANAMSAIKAKGIVHRDLKPQNILLCHAQGIENPAPRDITLKIADFGFARFLQDGVMAGTLCGSPMYMAPEVIMSLKYDAKADLWSIGTIVFQCLTGKAPFHATTPQALKNYYEQNPRLRPKIPEGTSPELTDLLRKLLKRNASDRMDFEEFFNHPFLKPIQSLPVTIPTQPSSLTRGEIHGTSPIHTSPFTKETGWGDEDQQSLEEQIRMNFRKMDMIDEAIYTSSNLRSNQDPVDDVSLSDYVMVPSVINEESLNDDKWSSEGSARASVEITPGGVTYRPESQTPATKPIPVPSQRQAFEQMERSRSPSPKAGSPASLPKFSPPPPSLRRDSSCSSERLGTPDITNMSPPTVQFSIGTPPQAILTSTGRRRSLSGGSPPPWRQSPQLMYRTSSNSGGGGSLSSSPLRRSGQPLSPILASPAVDTGVVGTEWNRPINSELEPYRLRHNSSPFQLAFQAGGGRTMTLPDIHGSSPPPPVSSPIQRSGSMDAVVPYLGEHRLPLFPLAGTSPPTSDQQMMFLAPELSEETLQEKVHSQNLVKLNYINSVVECIMEMAAAKSSPISAISQSLLQRDNEQQSVDKSSGTNSNNASSPFGSEGQRRAEQLVLYMRALHLLSSALNFSQQEVAAGRLHPSSKVKSVLISMNQHFRQCLSICKSLNSPSLLQSSGVDLSSCNITADKLIYTYAIEMCQSAALEELFGRPEQCFRRYQTAQILLHSLLNQVSLKEDQAVLHKYKTAVEKRLMELKNQGYIIAYSTQ